MSKCICSFTHFILYSFPQKECKNRVWELKMKGLALEEAWAPNNAVNDKLVPLNFKGNYPLFMENT